MLRVGEPVTTQASVLDCPVRTFAGGAAKLAMTAAFPTSTATVAAVIPKALVAVREKVYVVKGLTETVVPVTAPSPPFKVRVGEPVVVQLSVPICPGVRFPGLALKLVITGGLPTVTVTVAEPTMLVAVRV
jgi:predicted amidohydrolase